MTIEIDPALSDELPATVRNSLGKMSSEQQSVFEGEYKRKRKDKILLTLLAVFLPTIQFFMLGKVGLAVLFWITIGGCGIWYAIECFLTPKRVREWNHGVASEIMRDMKIMET